jgi:beta propeller repeat protein
MSTPLKTLALCSGNLAREHIDRCYFWDGAFPIVPTQITNNSTSGSFPVISGSNIVWQGTDGSDYDIYMATLATPSPVPALPLSGLLVTAVLLGLAGWRSLLT